MSESLEDPRLTAAWRAYDDDDLDRALSLARDLANDSDPALSLDAKRLQALAYFKSKQYADAARASRVIVESGGNIDDWSNLAVFTTMSGDLAGGLDAYQKTLDRIQAELKTESTFNTKRFYHLFKLYYLKTLCDAGACDQAAAMLDDGTAVYAAAGFTDDHLLYTHAIPFFGQALEVIGPVLRYAKIDANAWLDRFAAHLDDEGKERLERLREELQRHL